jgi:hypothetical protein
MVYAGVTDQALKGILQLRLGMPGHQTVMQAVDEVYKLLVIVIEQLHSDVQLAGPGYDRHLRQSFPEQSAPFMLRTQIWLNCAN